MSGNHKTTTRRWKRKQVAEGSGEREGGKTASCSFAFVWFCFFIHPSSCCHLLFSASTVVGATHSGFFALEQLSNPSRHLCRPYTHLVLQDITCVCVCAATPTSLSSLVGFLFASSPFCGSHSAKTALRRRVTLVGSLWVFSASNTS